MQREASPFLLSSPFLSSSLLFSSPLSAPSRSAPFRSAPLLCSPQVLVAGAEGSLTSTTKGSYTLQLAFGSLKLPANGLRCGGGSSVLPRARTIATGILRHYMYSGPLITPMLTKQPAARPLLTFPNPGHQRRRGALCAACSVDGRTVHLLAVIQHPDPARSPGSQQR